MPQRRSDPGNPPEVMTWGTALPVIILAGIFDVVQAFFSLFWFFGPALAALGCTAGVNSVVGTSLASIAGKIAAGGCALASGAVGIAASTVTASFGVIMSDAVGLAAFLTLGLWVVLTNARIVKAVLSAPLWFAGIFAAEEVPFLGTLPLFTIIMWRLYATQIRVEQEAYKKWEAETAQARQLEQAQHIAQLREVQEVQAQREVAQEELYREELDARAEEEERTSADRSRIP